MKCCNYLQPLSMIPQAKWVIQLLNVIMQGNEALYQFNWNKISSLKTVINVARKNVQETAQNDKPTCNLSRLQWPSSPSSAVFHSSARIQRTSNVLDNFHINLQNTAATPVTINTLFSFKEKEREKPENTKYVFELIWLPI